MTARRRAFTPPLMQRLLLTLLVAVVLTGCAGPRVIDTLVTSSTPAPMPVVDDQGHYRFERLPSQQGQPDTEPVEALAQEAMSGMGWVRDDSTPRYSAQISTRADVVQYFPYGPPRLRPYGGFVMGPRLPPSVHYRYELTLLLRDLGTGQLVYETSAFHEGPWADRENILRAMLAAALQGFPTPPVGPRTVQVQLPN